MISKELIKKAEEFAVSEIKEYGVPVLPAFNLSNQKGQEISEKLGANKEIVLLGTILMDCKLGFAKKEGRSQEHVRESEEAANKFLSQFPELEESDKENILHCIKEHHGINKFYSLESEICCNADCYRFLAVKGIMGNMREIPGMTVDEIVKLCLEKTEEKHNLLSLDIVRKELEPQYLVIKEFLRLFSN